MTNWRKSGIGRLFEKSRTKFNRIMNEQTEINQNENQKQEANQHEELVDVGPAENEIPQPENDINAGKENQDEATVWKLKFEESNDKFLRLYSEFDNFRKRTAREKIELSKTAGEDIMKSILPVLDDFDRGLKSMNESTDVEALKEGVNLVYHKLKTILQQKGLEEMDATGKDFDADIHEAITNIPAPDESMKGKVIDQVEKGYALQGKVIRFAKVVVGS
jgi:molecular chaperone GrpE